MEARLLPLHLAGDQLRGRVILRLPAGPLGRAPARGDRGNRGAETELAQLVAEVLHVGVTDLGAEAEDVHNVTVAHIGRLGLGAAGDGQGGQAIGVWRGLGHVVRGLGVRVGRAAGNVVAPRDIELLATIDQAIEVTIVLVIHAAEAEVITLGEDNLGVGINPRLGGHSRGLVGHLFPGGVVLSLDLGHVSSAVVEVLGGDGDGLGHLVVVNVPEHSLALDRLASQPGLAGARGEEEFLVLAPGVITRLHQLHADPHRPRDVGVGIPEQTENYTLRLLITDCTGELFADKKRLKQKVCTKPVLLESLGISTGFLLYVSWVSATRNPFYYSGLVIDGLAFN